MLSVNGFMMDIRHAPREAQEVAINKGIDPVHPRGSAARTVNYGEARPGTLRHAPARFGTLRHASARSGTLRNDVPRGTLRLPRLPCEAQNIGIQVQAK